MKTFRPHRGLGRTRRHALKKQWVGSLWRQENPATSEPVLWGHVAQDRSPAPLLPDFSVSR